MICPGLLGFCPLGDGFDTSDKSAQPHDLSHRRLRTSLRGATRGRNPEQQVTHMEYTSLLTAISDRYHKLLGENLVGIYIHGSIAFGCFNWERSDIDFIAVVNAPLHQEVKLQLLHTLEALRPQAPPKGFEMSVVLAQHCKNFAHPTPYELHFSNDWLPRYLEDPLQLCTDDTDVDYDLAAHFTVIKTVGIVLHGKPISEVFGCVPKEHYLDSIRKDIENAKDDVAGSPTYIILNLCRVYGYMRDGLVLSKETGGRWGVNNLPKQYQGLISAALDNYINGTKATADEHLQADFCDYMTGLIFKEGLHQGQGRFHRGDNAKSKGGEACLNPYPPYSP